MLHGIGARIGFGFLLVIALTAAVGIVAWRGLSDFAEQAEAARNSADLVAEINRIGRNVGTYRLNPSQSLATSVVGALDAVSSEITATAGRGDPAGNAGAGSTAASRALQAYRAAFLRFVELEQRNSERRGELEEEMASIEALSDTLREQGGATYATLTTQLEAAETELARRLATSTLSRQLIEAALRARQFETSFRLTRSAQDLELTNDAIKTMFLATVRLRRQVKDTEDEAPVARVSEAVNNYRKAFGEFSAEFQSGASTSQSESQLARQSRAISAFTAAVERRQESVYAEVAASTEAARASVGQSIEVQLAARELAALVGRIRAAELSIATAADPEAVASEVTTLSGSILRQADVIAANAFDIEAMTPILDQIRAASRHNSETFATVATAVVEQRRAVATMGSAQEAAIGAIRSIASEQQAGMETRRQVSSNLVVIGSIVSVGLGIALALLIGVSIARPVRAMTGALRRLARDEAGVDIPGQGRRDEIGEMASAAQSFKEANAAASRARARELETIDEVKVVVEAAAHGDFSQRMDLGEKEGFLLELSEGLNRLLETTADALRQVADQMGKMAQGDLSVRLETAFDGTFEALRLDANEMAERLSQTMGQIIQVSQEVDGTANEISSGSDDLAHRTEQQAATLEETAAAMEELTATVRNNSQNAQRANAVAASAREAADQSGGIVRDAVGSMDQIKESSERISGIIGVISEIAFQTNLLALNASVEAARAGEAGKGFAVVASEVRSLAERSAQASRDIEDQIKNTASLVGTGVSRVNSAGSALEKIAVSVKEVADLVAQIAAASAEQATGIEEVSVAVSSMDEMTQQNAALVEETSAATRVLADHARDLTGLMNTFRIGAPRLSAPESGGAATRALRDERDAADKATPARTESD